MISLAGFGIVDPCELNIHSLLAQWHMNKPHSFSSLMRTISWKQLYCLLINKEKKYGHCSHVWSWAVFYSWLTDCNGPTTHVHPSVIVDNYSRITWLRSAIQDFPFLNPSTATRAKWCTCSLIMRSNFCLCTWTKCYH